MSRDFLIHDVTWHSMPHSKTAQKAATRLPPDGPALQAKAHKTQNRVNKYRTQPPVTLQNVTDESGNQVGNNFPGQFIPADSYDDTFERKKRLIEKNPFSDNAPTQFVAEVTPEDLAYMKRKDEVQDMYNYESWKQSLWDHADPSSVYIAREKGLTKFADQKALEEIDRQCELQKQVARMRILGPAGWTDKDLPIAYQIKRGEIQLADGPLWDPKSYKFGNPSYKNKQRGFFNPIKLFPKLASTYLRKNNDPFPDLKEPGKIPGNMTEVTHDWVTNSEFGGQPGWLRTT